MHYFRFHESFLGGFSEGETNYICLSAEWKLAEFGCACKAYLPKYYELARIVIAKCDFKPHGSFSANWMLLSAPRVWGIAVSVVGTHFPNDLYCHLTLIKSGGVCGIIVLAVWNHPFKISHLAVLIENATWCKSVTMWHILMQAGGLLRKDRSKPCSKQFTGRNYRGLTHGCVY